MKKITKILALILCAVMLFSNVCVYSAEVDVSYSGTGDLEIGDRTYFDDEKTQPRFSGKGNIEGNYGKASNDLVYKLEGYSAADGGAKDYISYWPYNRTVDKWLLQSQICLTDNTTNIDYLIGFFTDDNSDGKDSNAGGNMFRIKNGKVTVDSYDWIPETWRYKEIATVEKYKWYNIAMTFSVSEHKVCIYINGEEKANIQLECETYGLRHMRIATGKAPDETNKVPFEAYIDNMRLSKNTEYSANENKLTQITSDKYAISNNMISLSSVDESAYDVLSNVSAENANVRIYSDAEMTKRIVNDEPITKDSVLVCATKNEDGLETAYNYYNFKLADDESGIYSGTKYLELAKNTSLGITNGAQELTYPYAGNYGKKASDFTYYWKGETIGNGGHLYMAWWTAPENTPAEVFEISFLLGDKSTGFHIGPSWFFAKSDGTDDTNFMNSFPFEVTLEDGLVAKNFTASNIKSLGYSLDGTENIFAQSTYGKKICDIEKNKWYSLTFVFPADGTNKFLLYVNGEKHECELNFKAGRIRHTKVYANVCSDQNMYFDNLKVSYMTTAQAQSYVCRDKKEKVEFTGYEVEKNVVRDIKENTTVADLKQKIVTEANIRIYSDEECTNLMADSDIVTEKTTIVAASTNGTVHERVYDYYKVTIASDYDELTNGLRIENFKLNENSNDYYAEFKVKNLSDNEQKITVALALYDEEMTLEDIKVSTITVSSGESKTLTAADSLKIGRGNTKGSVYAYIWLDGSVKPVCSAVHADFAAVN